MDASSAIHFIVQVLELLKWLIFIQAILSWVPGLDWYRQPFKLLRDLTEPILGLFRRIIPPLMGLDFSPILAYFALMLLSQFLSQFVYTF